MDNKLYKMNPIKTLLLSLFLLFGMTLPGMAQDLNALFGDEPQFLPVDEAFVFDFQQQDDRLILRWRIAEGYYLYKKQFKTALQGVALGEPEYPPATQIEDEYFGVSDVFFEQVDIQYPIQWSEKDGVVKVRYQGCAEAGLCYPATTKVVYLNAVAGQKADSQGQETAGVEKTSPTSSQFELADLLSSDQHLALTLALFMVLGIGLALTPCVFPMYPILSGIILGQGKGISTLRAFSLSMVYVQGMAITYSLLGLVVASAGVKFQAALQHPAILGVLIVVFVLLSLVMFGLWQFQLPSSWQQRLNTLSNQQQGGQLAGVFLMGVISGLVASPCTTAPLTGILLFVAQSGDLLLGFGALYALSLGMGIPLILFGITGGKLLPKAGAWMDVVKVSFGFMMLAVALLLLERLQENLWTHLGWALLGLSAFTYWHVMNQGTPASFYKGVRQLFIFLGLFASALYGYQSLSHPSSSLLGQEMAPAHGVKFMRVKDLADFERKLGEANAQGKSVMIDLYADWCVACKEFEKYTFPDAAVKAALANTVLMQIDLTDNTPQSLEFQQAFSILGLPTILFFDKAGNELREARVTGFMNAEKFARHLTALPL